MKRFSNNISMLGLTFEGGMLTAMEIRGAQDHWELKNSLREPLSQNILTGNAELVGAEIRKHLENAGIRERRCVVCIPLSWSYFLHLELPEGLSDQDRESYIRLQAEREFPFNPEDLILSISFLNTSEGKNHATVAAVSLQHIHVLQKALNAAKLKPRSMTLGITSLVNLKDTHNNIVLVFHRDGVDMGIIKDGIPVCIRSFTNADSTENEGVSVETDTLIRELRITLGSLPAEIRKGIDTLSFIGDSMPEKALRDNVMKFFSRLGIEEKSGETKIQGIDVNKVVSPYALAATINQLTRKSACLEFLPPSTGRIKKILGRVSARRFFWLAFAAATVIFFICCAFFIQYRYLASLDHKWKIMEPDVKEVEVLKENLKKYRPWYDDTIHGLSLLRDMTKAFPEKGDVWVKTLEIRNLQEVQFSGEARNNRVWLEMFSKLRQISSIEDLKVLQVKEGEGFIQFSIKFVWKGTSNGI